MPSTFPTPAELRTEFEQRKKDISDIDQIPGTFLLWCNYINRYAYKKFTNILPESYILTQQYTLTPGTIAYTLPDDFQDIIPQGTGLYPVSASGLPTDSRLPTTNYASTKTGFYMNMTQIVMTPVPTEAKTFIFRYIPLLDDLVDEDEDELVVPTRFTEYLMNALDTCYNIWDEDQQAEVFNDERFVRSMNDLVMMIKPDSQSVVMPDFMCSY